MTPDEEAMRAAARELIAAGRSLLDAAEAIVDDPAAARRVAMVVTAIAEQVQQVLGDVVGDRFDGSTASEGSADEP
jgi:hypothetical protein